MHRKERRSVPRHVRVLPGLMAHEMGGTRFITKDVSLHGMLVLADRAVLPGTRVTVTIALEADSVEATGVVVRTVSPVTRLDGRAELAVHFTHWAPAERERWTAYMAECMTEDVLSFMEEKAAEEPLHVEIRPEDLDTFMQIYVKQVRQGGLFMDGDLGRPIGSAVKVSFLHPFTSQRHVMSAVVTRTPTEVGVGTLLRFVGMQEGWKVDFLHFMGNEPFALDGITSPQPTGNYVN